MADHVDEFCIIFCMHKHIQDLLQRLFRLHTAQCLSHHIPRSGTRREELLLSKEELEGMYEIGRASCRERV